MSKIHQHYIYYFMNYCITTGDNNSLTFDIFWQDVRLPSNINSLTNFIGCMFNQVKRYYGFVLSFSLSYIFHCVHTMAVTLICAYFQESSDDDCDDEEAEMMALLKKKQQQYMSGSVQKPAHTEHVLVSTSSLLPVQNTKLYGGGKVEGILTIV